MFVFWGASILHVYNHMPCVVLLLLLFLQLYELICSFCLDLKFVFHILFVVCI